jgi:hypothetical protein
MFRRSKNGATITEFYFPKLLPSKRLKLCLSVDPILREYLYGLPNQVSKTEYPVPSRSSYVSMKTVIVKPTLDLKWPVREVVLKVFGPAFCYLRIFVIDDDIRDRVLTQLEDRRVDERVRQEVVPTPPEHLLDRDGQIGVSDVEEWGWVVDSLNRAAVNTATGLRET